MATQQTVYQITAQDGTAAGWATARTTAAREMGEIEKRSQTSADRINTAFQAIKGLAIAGAIKESIGALTEAQMAAQKLAASLNFSSGGRAGEQLDYLRETTRKLGLDFGTASAAFASFSAAAKGTGIGAETIKSTFEGISKAASQLGLSTDETQGALLALSQIISKGTVQSEELRGQLGERLPGAFNLAAKAMGLTTAELGKLLESGKLTASEFLPKFAAELNKTYQATDNLVAATNRLTSAWDDWKRTLSDGATGSGINWLTRGLNESAAAMRELGNEASIVRRILVAIGGFEAGALNKGKFDTTQVRSNLQTEFAQAQDQIKAINTLKDKQGGYLDAFQTQTLADYERQLKKTRVALDELAMEEGRRNGIKLPNLKEDMAAQQAKRAEALKGYLADSKFATKSEKISADIAAENLAFEKATSDFDRNSKDYARALKAHTARIAEIKKGDKEKTARTKKDNINAGEDLTAARDYANILKTLSDQQATATATAAGLTGSQATLQKLMASPEWERMPEAWRATVKAQADATASAEQLLRGQTNVREAYDKTIQPLRDHLAGLEKEVDLYGLTESQINTTIAARLDEAVAIAKANGATEDQIKNLELEASIRRDIAGVSSRKEVLDANAKAADESKKAWEKASDDISRSMTDGIYQAMENGKPIASAFASSFGNAIKTTLLRAVTDSLLSPIKTIIGQLTGSIGTSMGTSIAALFSANGNAFSDGGHLVRAFATGGIFDKPTGFAYAGGLGVLGEKGPESIMPLRRNSAGQLGVIASGSNSAQNIRVEIINQTSQPATATSATPRFDANGLVVDVVLRDLRNNGPIRQALGS